MTQKPFRNLDQLLSSWSASHDPSQEHLDRLMELIEQSDPNATDPDSPDVPTADAISTPSSPSSGRVASLKLVLSVAAGILIIVPAVLWMASFRFDESRSIAVSRPAMPIETISDGQILHKQDLLAELDRMFAGKRVWFAETETEVVLGGDVRASASDIAGESTLAMRLVLARRMGPAENWQRVWSADVVARTDQVVQFVSHEPQQATATFTGWAHLLPDGLVACDVDLKWNDRDSVLLSDSLLLSPGSSESGASLDVDGVEYRLFHAVSLLDRAEA